MRKDALSRLPPDRVSTCFRREWFPLTIVAVTGIFYNVGLAAGPLLEGRLVQRLLEILRGTLPGRAMLPAAALYAAVTAFVQGMRYLKRFYVRRFANNVGRFLKRVLYHSLVRRSGAELEQSTVGELMTRAIADADACAEGMRKFTTEVFDTGVAMLAYAALLLWYDWRLALLCGVFPPVSLLLAERMKTRVTRRAAESKESAARLNGATLDRVSGAITYRVFGLEAVRDADYETHLADYQRRAAAVNLWENAMPPLYRCVALLGTVPIVYLGGKNVAGTGWASWDVAAFTAFLACYGKLAVKTSKAAKLFNSVQKARVSWKRIQPLLKPIQPDPEPVTLPAGTLKAENVSFAWPGGPEILRDVSFTVEPGQIVGVTGPVACGKSTLGKLFLLEHPYQGSIRFGGRELRTMSEAERRGLTGYLGHKPELLTASVEDNILLGDDGDPDALLRAVRMDGETAAMPEGKRTLVGDAGVRLSGGQQARLALARTLAHPRPLVVLDDPFSAVDTATEGEILEALRAFAGDKAVLLISHRLDRFPELDGVLWMEDGRVVQGTHGELMETCPSYAELYRTQTEGGSGHGEE